MSSVSPNDSGLNGVLKEMRLLPWKFHQLNGEHCLSKFWASSDSYCFLLSDLNAFYLEHLTPPAIEQKFEELNPGMQMPLHRILSLLEKIIPHLEEGEMSGSLSMIKNGNNEIILQSKTAVAGIPLIWQFSLTKCDKDLLKEQLLKPLIGMITELQQRQNFLISLIKKKDAEIEDYKEGGAKVSRKYLGTLKFDENKFLDERSCPEVLSETLRTSLKTTFDNTNDNFYVAVATAHSQIKEQEQNRLLESEELKETAKDTVEDEDCSHSQSNSEETEKEREIARRKELEQKLLSKPAKKKKKIAF